MLYQLSYLPIHALTADEREYFTVNQPFLQPKLRLQRRFSVCEADANMQFTSEFTVLTAQCSQIMGLCVSFFAVRARMHGSGALLLHKFFAGRCLQVSNLRKYAVDSSYQWSQRVDFAIMSGFMGLSRVAEHTLSGKM